MEATQFLKFLNRANTKYSSITGKSTALKSS